jgi:hypothetical protein
MIRRMDASLISGFAALAGAAIGGLTSATAGWLSQRYTAHAQWIANENLRRLDIYRDFIQSASQCYIHALQHDEPDISGLVGLYTHISRMRVLATAEIVEKAEQVAQRILDTYTEPDRSFAELRSMAKNHTIDLLYDFSSACRLEHERYRHRQL